MKINPYLVFDGKCAEAFKFYEQTLGGEIVMMMKMKDSPMAEECSPGMQDKIMHVRLVVGDQVLMGSDSPPEYFEKQQGMSVSLNVDTPEEAERIFAALSENARIIMAITETFWAHRFGMLVDRFGTPWMLNCEKPMKPE